MDEMDGEVLRAVARGARLRRPARARHGTPAATRQSVDGALSDPAPGDRQRSLFISDKQPRDVTVVRLRQAPDVGTESVDLVVQLADVVTQRP